MASENSAEKIEDVFPGCIFDAVIFENDAPEKLLESYFELNDPDISSWQPNRPSCRAILVDLFDSHDGPIALFATPHEA